MSATVQFLIDLIQHTFINRQGLLSSTYPPTANHLLNDFNDYIPFLLYYECRQFVEDQFSRAQSEAVNDLIPSGERILSWRQDEWLEGLRGIYDFTQSPDVLCQIRRGLRFINGPLTQNGAIKSFYNLTTHRSPAVFDPRTGALIEVLLDLDVLSPIAKSIALSCLDRVVEWAESNRQYLIPNFLFFDNSLKTRLTQINPLSMPKYGIYPYATGFRTLLADILITLPWASEIKLAKQNTNLIHSMLRAYEITGDNRYLGFVNSWMTEFLKLMYNKGSCYSSPRRDLVKLSHNHPVIEICLELFRLSGQRKYLDLALEIINFWLAIRFQNGLFPESERSSFSHLDHQTDMIVLLVKCAELACQPQYVKAAEEVLEAVLRHHRTQHGFVTRLHRLEQTPPVSSTIHPKYNALFLKSFIALENQDSICDDRLTALLRDR